MPVTCKVCNELQLIVSEYKGVVPDEEFLQSYQAVINHPDFDYRFKRLTDLRETDSSARSKESLQTIAIWRKDLYKDISDVPKTAIVAPKDLSFGLVKMYEKFNADVPGEINVFRTLEEALEWLEIDIKAYQNATYNSTLFGAASTECTTGECN